MDYIYSLFIPQISFLIGIQSLLYYLIIIVFNTTDICPIIYVIPYCFIILAPALREVKLDYIKVASSLEK